MTRQTAFKGAQATQSTPLKKSLSKRVPGSIKKRAAKPADVQKTDTVSARINPALKAETASILEKLGLTYSEAITLFLSQVALQRGIPFDVKIPNAVTRQAMKDASEGKNMTKASSVEELKKLLHL